MCCDIEFVIDVDFILLLLLCVLVDVWGCVVIWYLFLIEKDDGCFMVNCYCVVSWCEIDVFGKLFDCMLIDLVCFGFVMLCVGSGIVVVMFGNCF